LKLSLQTWSGKLISVVTITESNKKGRATLALPFPSPNHPYGILSTKHPLSVSCDRKPSRSNKERWTNSLTSPSTNGDKMKHGGGFGDGNRDVELDRRRLADQHVT